MNYTTVWPEIKFWTSVIAMECSSWFKTSKLNSSQTKLGSIIDGNYKDRCSIEYPLWMTITYSVGSLFIEVDEFCICIL